MPRGLQACRELVTALVSGLAFVALLACLVEAALISGLALMALLAIRGGGRRRRNSYRRHQTSNCQGERCFAPHRDTSSVVLIAPCVVRIARWRSACVVLRPVDMSRR